MSELEIRLGKVLQLERENRHLALADIANELKISESNLEAIEAGDTSALPSDLYYGLFAKSFAERLGIDYNKTVEAIREDLGETLEPVEELAAEEAVVADERKPRKEVKRKPEPAEEPDEASRGFLKKAIIIGAVVVLAFAGIMALYVFVFDGNDTIKQAVLSVGADSSAEVAEAEESSEEPEYAWDSVVPVRTDSLRLSITAREQTWATVLVDGDTALYQNLTPWREYQLAARYRFLVSIGIPRVAEVKLDGVPVYLADVVSGRVSQVEINQVNKGEFSEPPAPVRATPPLPQPSEDSTGADSAGGARRDRSGVR